MKGRNWQYDKAHLNSKFNKTGKQTGQREGERKAKVREQKRGKKIAGEDKHKREGGT